ncbi:NADH-quinone oxidoreductase subunit F, partial [bacterium]|nr:NADH-quinone oxidoreductase subunit F [bacterium]
MALEYQVFQGLDRSRKWDTLEGYKSDGGYAVWEKIMKDKMKPEDVIKVVKDSGLRGRGGAGFPTGLKWSFVPQNVDKPKYLLCNADESEPGTFKDREILEHSAHQLIEGMLIASYAFGSEVSYIYIRGEFVEGWQKTEEALAEAREAGYIGENILGSGWSHQMWTHRGGGA